MIVSDSTDFNVSSLWCSSVAIYNQASYQQLQQQQQQQQLIDIPIWMVLPKYNIAKIQNEWNYKSKKLNKKT